MKQPVSAVPVYVVWLLMLLPAIAGAQPSQKALNAGAKMPGKAGLVFTENRGQVADKNGQPHPDILFTAGSRGAKIFLTATGIHYQFSSQTLPAGHRQAGLSGKKGTVPEGAIKTATHRFTLSLAGANPVPHIRKEEKSPYTENFYLAHCPEGITGVSTFSRIVYENVYPGIDWVVYSNGSGMKYDFIVHPGADYKMIRLKISDADGVRISSKGELVIKSSLGEVREEQPVSFCGSAAVASRFAQARDGAIGFDVADYDRQKTLTIDPAVAWGTYYGGAGYEEGYGCTTDPAGNIYLTGFTSSLTGIAAAGHQAGIGGSHDAYLVKFNSAGTRLWCTYYGGTDFDSGEGCTTDQNGNVFMTGYTYSQAGIASNGHQSTKSLTVDAFLVKFNPAGVRMWGTYYGGAGMDYGYDCATDGSGNVYLAGHTQVWVNNNTSTDLAFAGHQSTGGANDAFLVKFSATGTRLWATYYGGAGGEVGWSCAVDVAQNVYLAGHTGSVNAIATAGAHQAVYGGGPTDCFLAKFSPAGSRLWGTYYGGSADETEGRCAADVTGNILLSGRTGSANGIAANGFQNTPGGNADAFLVRLNPGGTRLWGTYYGGGLEESSPSCTTDAFGNIILSGSTGSFAGIASGGFQNAKDAGVDAYLVKFNPAGSRLWASYLGGNNFDNGRSCATDGDGNIYLCGWTQSLNNIGLNGHLNTQASTSGDAFLVKVGADRQIFTGVIPGPLCTGASIAVPFTSIGNFSASNIYTAQLSDASGSFAAPVPIGTLASAANSGTISSIIPANTPLGLSYRVRVVSSAPAVTGADNLFDLEVKSIPAQPTPILGDTVVCPGTLHAYNSVVVPGATSYSWTVPPTWTGNNGTTSIMVVAGSSGGVLALTATNACGNSVPRELAVSISPPGSLIPSVTISAVNPSFCTSTPASFTAIPVNGGFNPVYQWKKNGVNVGTNAPTYTDSTPQNGTTISVEIVSDAPCAASGAFVSNSITETISGTTVPGININTNPPHQLCAGTPIQFTSNITAGGTSPQYAWYKNGVLLPGETGPTYTDPALQNGDTVQAFLTSSEGCPVTQPTPSNRRGVIVAPVVTPTLSLSVAPGTTGLTIGTPLTFTAAHTGGGTNPSFFWKKNGVTISAAGPTYTTLFSTGAGGVGPGDQIEVTMASSDHCAVPAIVSSGIVRMGAPLSIGSTEAPVRFAVYPNPTTGQFTVEGEQHPGTGPVRIAIFNAIGQSVLTTEAKPRNGYFSMPVKIDGSVANGLYQLRISSGDAVAVKPLLLQR